MLGWLGWYRSEPNLGDMIDVVSYHSRGTEHRIMHDAGDLVKPLMSDQPEVMSIRS